MTSSRYYSKVLSSGAALMIWQIRRAWARQCTSREIVATLVPFANLFGHAKNDIEFHSQRTFVVRAGTPLQLTAFNLTSGATRLFQRPRQERVYGWRTCKNQELTTERSGTVIEEGSPHVGRWSPLILCISMGFADTYANRGQLV